MEATDWVALIAAGIALIGSCLTLLGNRQAIKASKESSAKSNEVAVRLGEMSAETQGKQRLIETVSAQRVEWINRVRDYFSQFNKVTFQIAEKRSENQEFGDINYELVYLVNHIELFLNPTEIITKKFIERKDVLSSYLLNDREGFSWNYYSSLMYELHYIEQVILKAEWKRLKEETKTGIEVANMEEIHKVTAQKIDLAKYTAILKADFEKNS